MDNISKRTITYEGEKIEGDWFSINGEDKGVFTFPDGRQYEGDFVAGKREGKGVLTFADGGGYEGDFVGNNFEGKGIENLTKLTKLELYLKIYYLNF